MRYAAHDAPGFTIILEGECWITFEGQEPARFGKGDFLLLPSTPPFSLSSHPGIEGAFREPMDIPVRHGDQEGEPDFVSLGGTFRIEQANAALFPALLALAPDAVVFADRLVHASIHHGFATTITTTSNNCSKRGAAKGAFASS